MYRANKNFMKDPATANQRIYIGNVAETVVSSDLEGKFQQHGKILGLVLLQGFGFIQYEKDAEAQTAIKTEHGKMFHGKQLNVRQAIDKAKMNQPGNPTVASPNPKQNQKPPNAGNTQNPPHFPIPPKPLMATPSKPLMGGASEAQKPLLPNPNDSKPPFGAPDAKNPPIKADTSPAFPTEPLRFQPAKSDGNDSFEKSPADEHRFRSDFGMDNKQQRMDKPLLGHQKDKPLFSEEDVGPRAGLRKHDNFQGDDMFRGNKRDNAFRNDRMDNFAEDIFPEQKPKVEEFVERGRNRGRGGRGRNRNTANKNAGNDKFREGPTPHFYPREQFTREPEFQEKPPAFTPPNFGAPPPIADAPERNDCEIIVVSKLLTEYAEYIEQRLKFMGLSVDLLFPMSDVPIGRVLANISSRGCLYAILVMPQNEEHRSLTLNILHGIPQEHRNMPVEDALIMISRNFDSYMRGEKLDNANTTNGNMSITDRHPEAMQMILNLLAENRQLTVAQYERIIKYLLERKDLQAEADVAEGEEPITSEPLNKQAELQNRIMSILNKANESPKQVEAPPPQVAPSNTPLLQDPSVQKALDSLLAGDMFKGISA